MAVNAPTGIDPSVLAALLSPFDPIILVPTASPAVDGVLIGMEGVLQGWALREAGATAGANQVKEGNTVTGTQVAVALTDTGGEQTFITGFDVTLGIAAAAASVQVQVTGVATPLDYEVTAETTGNVTLSIRYPQPVPGSAITVTLPAVGGGAAANSVTVYGTDSASVACVLELYSGSSAGGELLATIAIPPGLSTVQSLLAGALPFQGGLFLHVVSGTCKGTFWVRV